MFYQQKHSFLAPNRCLTQFCLHCYLGPFAMLSVKSTHLQNVKPEMPDHFLKSLYQKSATSNRELIALTLETNLVQKVASFFARFLRPRAVCIMFVLSAYHLPVEL